MSDEKTSTPNRNQRSRFRSISEKFSELNLLDPRSPTTAFERTPIQVILKNSTETGSDKVSPNTTCASASFVSLSTPPTVEDVSLELSASSASFVSFDDLTDLESINLSSDELSMMVSDFSSYKEDTEGGETPLMVTNELDRSIEESSVEPVSIRRENCDDTRDNAPTTPTLTNSENKVTSSQRDTPADKAAESALLIRKKPLKNVFYTPNPHKKRNPLGPVDNVCPTTPPSHLSPYASPQNTLGEKQWKRIQEERKKLGLEADENAQLPLYDITASAPSKLVRKSRLQARFNGVLS